MATNKLNDIDEERVVMDGNNGSKWKEVTSDWLGLVYRVIDSILLVGVLVYQNYTITYFITSFNRHNNVWYFLLLIDFLMVFLFMCGAYLAIRYYRKYHVLNRRRVFTTEEHSDKRQESSQKLKVFSLEFPKWLGTLPLVWFCWLFYALVLSAKIFLLHLQKITIQLRNDSQWMDTAEPHTVRLSLATMTVVFLLWIEIHRNHYSNRSLDCIKELTTAVVFEIFDSIDLLELLIPLSREDAKKMTDSIHAERLSIVVLFLSTINLLLPTIGLFRLSQNSFDSHRLGIRSNIVHNFLRIACINIPFMVLRVTYWTAFDKEISIFLLKNALFLFVSLRHIVSEVHELRKPKPPKQLTRRSNSVPLDVVSDNTDHEIN